MTPFRCVRIGGACCAAVALVATVSACARSPQAQRAYHVEKAERYASAGKLPEAIIEYRIAIEAEPQSGDAQLGLADTYQPRNGRHAHLWRLRGIHEALDLTVS